MQVHELAQVLVKPHELIERHVSEDGGEAVPIMPQRRSLTAPLHPDPPEEHRAREEQARGEPGGHVLLVAE
jgi:hypothetical protein